MSIGATTLPRFSMVQSSEGEPALLVIDAQRAHTNPRSDLYCQDAATTIEKINRLVAAFSKRKRAVVYIRHRHERDGSDLGRMWGQGHEDLEEFPFKKGTQDVDYAKELKRVRGAREVIKNRYNAFEETSLKHVLDEVDADRLVITGFMTGHCCASTARQAHDMDYGVTFLPDATGCPDLSDEWPQERIRAVVGMLLGSGFAQVEESEAYLEAQQG